MIGDGEDEGLWVLPGAEALFGDIGMATSAYPAGFFSENTLVCDGFQINIPEGYVNLAHTLRIEMPEQTIKGHSDYRRGFPGSGFGLPDFLWRFPDVSYKGGVRQ